MRGQVNTDENDDKNLNVAWATTQWLYKHRQLQDCLKVKAEPLANVYLVMLL